jgi:hypothetical protein
MLNKKGYTCVLLALLLLFFGCEYTETASDEISNEIEVIEIASDEQKELFNDDYENAFNQDLISSGALKNVSTGEQTSLINHISVITITSNVTNANTDDAIYFEALGHNDQRLVPLSRLDTSRNDFGKNMANRFEINCSQFTVDDIKSFKLSNYGSDGWHLYGLIVIINYNKIIFSVMNINEWIDQDSTEYRVYLLRDNRNNEWQADGFRKKLNFTDYITRCEIITTTSSAQYSDTDDAVYVRVSSKDIYPRVRIDSIYDDFERSYTDYFILNTYPQKISDLTNVEVSKKGSNGLRINTVIAIINDQVLFHYSSGPINNGFLLDNALPASINKDLGLFNHNPEWVGVE